MDPKGRGRKPDPEVDAAIREAILHLIPKRGLDVTYDQVAAYAGVGRASVFRRYPKKHDMLLEVFGQPVSVPDTGSLRGDLRAVLSAVWSVYATPAMYDLGRHLLGEACRDPRFGSLVNAIDERRLDGLRPLLRRAAERGELAEFADARVLGDLVNGHLAGLLCAGRPVPDEQGIHHVADLLVSGSGMRK